MNHHHRYYKHYGVPTALVDLDEQFKRERLQLVRRMQSQTEVVDNEIEGTVAYDEALKILQFIKRYWFKVLHKHRVIYQYWRQQGLD